MGKSGGKGRGRSEERDADLLYDTPQEERDGGGGDDLLRYMFANFSRWPLLAPDEERALLSLYLLSRKALPALAEALDMTEEELTRTLRWQVMRSAVGYGVEKGGVDERRIPKELRKDYALLLQGEEARARLVLSNARLVVLVAKRYAQQWPSVPLEDLVQEGFDGLFKAIDRFDYKMASKLSTYAIWWIRDAVEKALKRHLFVYRRGGGGEAKVGFVLSLDEPLDEDGNRYADTLPCPEAEEPDEDKEEMGKIVESILERLPPREAFVLASLYGLRGLPQLSYGALAHKLGVSETRVRQIERRGLSLASGLSGEVGADLVFGEPEARVERGINDAEEGGDESDEATKGKDA